MKNTLRIGTRDSALALWQARHIQQQLETSGYQTELVPVKSTGDLILDKPLYELGITGIFTKTLDVALLNGEIDLAVHSMKDVPTKLPKGIVLGAVAQRGPVHDVLVHKGDTKFLAGKGIIATGSLRRKAQWLNRYPKHQVTDLRGNVNSRLDKLRQNTWNGAIFAEAGLQRLGITPSEITVLHWMIPAPAQGAITVACRENDATSKEACNQIHHEETATCVAIEREFLSTLEGGCTAPIGAYAFIDVDYVDFKGILLSVDGRQKISVEKRILIENLDHMGHFAAKEILRNGGEDLMKKLHKELKKISVNDES